jgi:hypothetical protein
MTIEDIEAYIIRYNIDKKCREEYYIHNRMYIYSILFHINKWSLSRIGILFDVGHDTVRNALIEVTKVQHTDKFQDSVQLLYDQCYFIVPIYKNRYKKRGRNRIRVRNDSEYTLKMKVTKKKYFEFLDKQDSDIIYQMLWDLTIKKLKL